MQMYCSLQLVRWPIRNCQFFEYSIMQRRVTSTSLPRRFDVGIVGGGPCGLIMSYLLSSYGIESIIVEKKVHPTTHPQAHFINNRSMEIIRCHASPIFRQSVDQSPPSSYWRDFSYCHTITGRTIARVDNFEHNSIPISNVSPTCFIHFPQNNFEKVVKQDVTRSTHATDHCLFGYEVIGFENSIEGSNITVKKCTGNDEPITLSCKYLVAADGSNSFIRRKLGISMQGNEALQTLINVHFICSKLYKHLKPRPAMLYFTFNEFMVGVFVAHDPLKNEWVCQIPIFPPFQSIKDYDIAAVVDIILQGIGPNKHQADDFPTSKDIEVLSIKTWSMHAEVADKYSNSHNNVFLVGDAAHRFPPAGGFGMNTGIQDVHNLAWKLASVINNDCKSSALLTYEAERKPIAESNTRLSLQNYEKSAFVARYLGVDPTLAKLAVDTAKLLPNAVGKAAVLRALKLGLSTLQFIGIPGHPLGDVRVNAVKKIISENKSLPLLFPNEDLNFAYDSIKEGHASNQQQRKDRSKSFECSLNIGARVPHCWFRLTRRNSLNEFVQMAIQCAGREAEVSNERMNIQVMLSTLDLPTHFLKLQSNKWQKDDFQPIRHVLIVDREHHDIWMQAMHDFGLLSKFHVVSVFHPSQVVFNHDSLQNLLQEPRYSASGLLDDIKDQIVCSNNGNEDSYNKLVSIHRLLDYSHQPNFSNTSIDCNDTDYCLEDTSGRFRSLCHQYISGDGMLQSNKVLQRYPVVAIRPDGHVASIYDPSTAASRQGIDFILKKMQASLLFSN